MGAEYTNFPSNAKGSLNSKRKTVLYYTAEQPNLGPSLDHLKVIVTYFHNL